MLQFVFVAVYVAMCVVVQCVSSPQNHTADTGTEVLQWNSLAPTFVPRSKPEGKSPSNFPYKKFRNIFVNQKKTLQIFVTKFSRKIMNPKIEENEIPGEIPENFGCSYLLERQTSHGSFFVCLSKSSTERVAVCVVVCCSVLQCVAVCVVVCLAVYCSALQCVQRI